MLVIKRKQEWKRIRINEQMVWHILSRSCFLWILPKFSFSFIIFKWNIVDVFAFQIQIDPFWGKKEKSEKLKTKLHELQNKLKRDYKKVCAKLDKNICTLSLQSPWYIFPSFLSWSELNQTSFSVLIILHFLAPPPTQYCCVFVQ